MLKLNIDKYIDIIKSLDEDEIKLNKKKLTLLLRTKHFVNTLLMDVEISYYFCKWVINGRCEMLENAFTLDSNYALNYAAYILHDKLPDNLHNVMILKKLSESDSCANQYFIWLSNKEKNIDLGVWGDYK